MGRCIARPLRTWITRPVGPRDFERNILQADVPAIPAE
jgi:hypothetical protein